MTWGTIRILEKLPKIARAFLMNGQSLNGELLMSYVFDVLGSVVVDKAMDKIQSNLEIELEHLKKPKIVFDQSRRNAIINSEDVQACPGSGKTYSVAARLADRMSKWQLKYQGIA